MDTRASERLAFDNVPEIYDRARPEYPPQAFDEVFAYLRADRPLAETEVLEIGPGTGQATTALLARGARVMAVEIGSRMAAFLRQKFQAEPRLRVVNSAFEDVDLPARSFDLVFAATSFHWLDPDVGLRKSYDLLRPGGALATLSTIQVRSEADRGYFDRTHSIYERWEAVGRHIASPEPDDAAPTEYQGLRDSALFHAITIRRYRWDQTYSTNDYEALVRSYSGTNMMAPGAREGLLRDLREVLDREYGGSVTRPLVIALTMARRSKASA